MDWHENLTSDEVPPAWMWPFEEALEDWFDEVIRNRRAGRTPEPDEDDDTLENELFPKRPGRR